MRASRFLSISAASLVLAFAGIAHAQGGATREQVRMDRDTFLSMFSWNPVTSEWVLKSGMMPPKGVASRDTVIAMRDEFLKMNRWDPVNTQWVSLTAPREMSRLSRDQVENETLMFLMTHRYDETTGAWVSKMRRTN